MLREYRRGAPWQAMAASGAADASPRRLAWCLLAGATNITVCNQSLYMYIGVYDIGTRNRGAPKGIHVS